MDGNRERDGGKRQSKLWRKYKKRNQLVFTSIKWLKAAVIIFLSLPYHVCSLLLLSFSMHTFKINFHIWPTNVDIYCYRGLSYFTICDPTILDPMMYDSCTNYQYKLKLCLKIYKTRIMQLEHYILLKKRPRVFTSC